MQVRKVFLINQEFDEAVRIIGSRIEKHPNFSKVPSIESELDLQRYFHVNQFSLLGLYEIYESTGNSLPFTTIFDNPLKQFILMCMTRKQFAREFIRNQLKASCKTAREVDLRLEKTIKRAKLTGFFCPDPNCTCETKYTDHPNWFWKHSKQKHENLMSGLMKRESDAPILLLAYLAMHRLFLELKILPQDIDPMSIEDFEDAASDIIDTSIGYLRKIGRPLIRAQFGKDPQTSPAFSGETASDQLPDSEGTLSMSNNEPILEFAFTKAEASAQSMEVPLSSARSSFLLAEQTRNSPQDASPQTFLVQGCRKCQCQCKNSPGSEKTEFAQNQDEQQSSPLPSTAATWEDARKLIPEGISKDSSTDLMRVCHVLVGNHRTCGAVLLSEEEELRHYWEVHLEKQT